MVFCQCSFYNTTTHPFLFRKLSCSILTVTKVKIKQFKDLVRKLKRTSNKMIMHTLMDAI